LEQIRQKFYYFVSKKALNIDGLGPRIIDLLLDEGLIATFPDIFTLTEEQLSPLEGLGEKSAVKLIEQIKHARNITLPRFITALSIDGVGEETAHDLATYFGSFKNLQKASYEELRKIDGVGEVVAQSVIDWFSHEQNQELIKQLLKHVDIELYKDKRASTKFENKTFVITGTLDSMSRDEIKEQVRLRGGKVSNTVSKNTDFVIAGENPGSKFEKAQDLEVEVWDETTLLGELDM